MLPVMPIPRVEAGMLGRLRKLFTGR